MPGGVDRQLWVACVNDNYVRKNDEMVIIVYENMSFKLYLYIVTEKVQNPIQTLATRAYPFLKSSYIYE